MGQNLLQLQGRRVVVDFLHRRHFEEEVVDGIRVKGRQYGIRWMKWKYIDAHEQERRELYDLESDPDEVVDRLQAEPEQAARLARKLSEWLDAQGAASREMPRRELSTEERKALEALGYVE